MSAVAHRPRTVPAVFEAANTGGLLKIGQFARASVPVGGTVRGVVIPNEAILDDQDVCIDYLGYDEAIRRGAMALFGEKYGDEVRVLDALVANGYGWSAENGTEPHPYRIRQAASRSMWRFPVADDDWDYESTGAAPAAMLQRWQRLPAVDPERLRADLDALIDPGL